MEKKFYTKDGHLDDIGVALVIDALHRNQEGLLPTDILEHLKQCNMCMEEVRQLYEMTDGVFTLEERNPLLSKEQLAIASLLGDVQIPTPEVNVVSIYKPIKKKILNVTVFKVAASILFLLVSIAAFFFFSQKRLTQENTITDINQEEKENKDTTKTKSQKSEIEENHNNTENHVSNNLLPVTTENNISKTENINITDTIPISKPENNIKSEEASKLAIVSPFVNFDVPFIDKDKNDQAVEIIAEQGKSFYFPNGSNFHIPASAFVDEDGNQVRGKITIQYREFHEASEIIASGIPMNYTEYGVEYPFESAGMFELRAKQKGKAVFLAENKRIEVNLASNVVGDDFNFYYLNQEDNSALSNLTIQGHPLTSSFRFRLKFLGKPTWELLRENVPAKKNTFKHKKMDSLERIIPNEINKSNTFTLQFNTKKHKELKEMEGAYWTFAGWDKKTNPNLKENAWIKEKKWDKISITPIDKLKTPVVSELIGHQEAIISVAFSPNNQKVATASKDFSAKLWAIDGTLLKNFTGHKGFVTSVCFSSTGNYILTASRDRTAKLWDVKSGKLLTTFGGHTQGLTKAMFFPTDNKILTASLDGTCKIWDMNGNIIQNFTTGIVYDFDISKDGQKLFTAQAGGAKLWNIDGQVIQTFDKIFKKDEDAVVNTLTVLGVDRLITGDNRGNIIIWNSKGKVIKKIRTFVNSITKVDIDPDKNIVANGGKGGCVAIWDLQGKLLKQFVEIETEFDERKLSEIINTQQSKVPKTLRYKTKTNASFVFSSDKKFLLSGDWDKVARIWLNEISENYAQIELQVGQNNGLQDYKKIIVKINEQNKSTIQKYDYAHIKEVEREMQKVRMESNLIRSFEIDKLGIYNWDKVYKPSDAIQLTADFDFELESDKEEAHIFLITGDKQNIVIRCKPENLENFYFEPNMSNQIISILPNDRIAVFKKEDFDKLDYEKIKKEKRYTFDMKRSKKVKGFKDFKEILKS